MNRKIASHGWITETAGVGTQEIEKAETVMSSPVTYQQMTIPQHGVLQQSFLVF